MVDIDLPLVEVIGLPQFFITEIVTEVAGGGCVRLYGCTRQRGVLIPHYQTIMPYRSMIACAALATKTALTVLMEEQARPAH